MAKVFLVHFSGVLVCANKRFALPRVSNCQPRNLSRNSTLKIFFPDLFWFNPNQGRSSCVSRRCQGFLETFVSDTSKRLFAKRQNNFPVADEKRNQKWTWNQKLLWNILFWRIIEPRKRDRRSCFDNQTKTESLRGNFLLGCCSLCRCASVGARSWIVARARETQSNNLWMFRPYLYERASNVQHCALNEPLTQSTKCNWRKKLRPRKWKTGN